MDICIVGSRMFAPLAGLDIREPCRLVPLKVNIGLKGTERDLEGFSHSCLGTCQDIIFHIEDATYKTGIQLVVSFRRSLVMHSIIIFAYHVQEPVLLLEQKIDELIFRQSRGWVIATLVGGFFFRLFGVTRWRTWLLVDRLSSRMN